MDAIKAHEILRQQLSHYSGLVWQRIPAFIITNSVLVVGFLMSFEQKGLEVLKIGLPVIGVIMSLAFAFILREGARHQNLCMKGLRLIESEPEFNYMKEKKLRVYTDMLGEKRISIWCSTAYFAAFPAVLVAILWVLVLILM